MFTFLRMVGAFFADVGEWTRSVWERTPIVTTLYLACVYGLADDVLSMMNTPWCVDVAIEHEALGCGGYLVFLTIVAFASFGVSVASDYWRKENADYRTHQIEMAKHGLKGKRTRE